VACATAYLRACWGPALPPMGLPRSVVVGLQLPSSLCVVAVWVQARRRQARHTRQGQASKAEGAGGARARERQDTHKEGPSRHRRPEPHPSALEQAARQGPGQEGQEERFWALLADFVSLVASAPRSWLARYGPVPAGHPFICGMQQGGLAVGPRPAPVALSVLPPGPFPLPAP
jgi:hypothetical protein